MAVPKIEWADGVDPWITENSGQAEAYMAGLGVYHVPRKSKEIAPPNWFVLYKSTGNLLALSLALAHSGYVRQVDQDQNEVHVQGESHVFWLSQKGKEWVEEAFANDSAPVGLELRFYWRAIMQTLELIGRYGEHGSTVVELNRENRRRKSRLNNDFVSLKSLGFVEGGRRESTKQKMVQEYAITEIGRRALAIQRGRITPIKSRR